MALPPKKAVSTQTISIRAPEDFLQLLDDYVAYLGHATDRTYVLIESARQLIAADKGFKNTRVTRLSQGGSNHGAHPPNGEAA